jgi:hypothetical protein
MMFVRLERACDGVTASETPVDLVELISPRTNAAGYTPVEHLFAALSREGGVSLEIGGDASSRRFYARVAGANARALLNAQLGSAYPQARARPASVDTARRQPGEHVAAVSLHLREPEYLPLRIFHDSEIVTDRAPQADPLLGVLAAFGSMPTHWRALAQLVLQPAPADWPRRHLRRTLEHALEPERTERFRAGSSPGWGGVVLAAAFLAAVVVLPQLWAVYLTHGWLPLALLAVPVAIGLGAAHVLWIRLSERPLYDLDLVKEKLSRPVARAELRLAVFAPDAVPVSEVRARLEHLIAAYHAYDLERGNGFVAQPLVVADAADALCAATPVRPTRALATLTTRELAGLWHLVQAGNDVGLVERTTARRFLPLPETVADGARIGLAEDGLGHSVAVHMAGSDDRQQVAGGYVLVGDTGGLPPQALRSQFARLARLQLLTGRPAPVVAIATTSERRVKAWATVLDSLAAGRSRGLLETCIDTWDAWRARRITLPRNRRTQVAEPALAPPRLSQQPVPWASVPRPVDLALVRRALADWHVSAGDGAVLDLVARHPFLPPAAAGEVLGGDVRWARRRCGWLVHRGLVRVLPPDELASDLHRKDDLLEATVRGLTLLAGPLGLSLATAVRYHGLAGGGRETPVGPRRALLAHLAHTLGADGVFATVASAARLQRDGALLEWRNAAACARGRMRPDGYGLLCLGRSQHGFFLEFDRGTVHAAALRAKFAAYHRYQSSGGASREYDSFPTILVVTTGPGSEQRIVDALRATAAGRGSRLDVLVTTVAWIDNDSQGPFGSIWFDPERGVRRSWPGKGQDNW